MTFSDTIYSMRRSAWLGILAADKKYKSHRGMVVDAVALDEEPLLFSFMGMGLALLDMTNEEGDSWKSNTIYDGVVSYAYQDSFAKLSSYYALSFNTLNEIAELQIEGGSRKALRELVMNAEFYTQHTYL